MNLTSAGTEEQEYLWRFAEKYQYPLLHLTPPPPLFLSFFKWREIKSAPPGAEAAPTAAQRSFVLWTPVGLLPLQKQTESCCSSA